MAECFLQTWQADLAYVRQHKILVMRDAQLDVAVAIGQIGDGFHHVRRNIAWPDRDACGR